MPLKFHGNAICLSGLAGTQLKCDVIGEYYPFWWGITSGGPSANNQNPTAIVEMNAATGEVYIEDAKKTMLGSAGHALDLKVNNENTENLKIVLIEDNTECYANLRRVIKRRWPSVNLSEAEGPIGSNKSGIYLINRNLENALEEIESLNLGNSLFFFDPLRSVEYSTIRTVAKKRMKMPFQTGTEFFVFCFTSDWFIGRDNFAPLPLVNDEDEWSVQEKNTISEADDLFGNKKWREYLLRNISIKLRERLLITLYKKRLYRWFRYVLALPFNPKEKQLFHLILCSNFETGVRRTRDAYSEMTGNPKYAPNVNEAFQRFRDTHPETFRNLTGNRRPLQWRILWKIIRQHEGGLCDYRCPDLKKESESGEERMEALEWLLNHDYLFSVKIKNAWDHPINRYRLNWQTIEAKLGVNMPSKLRPISPQQLKRSFSYNQGA
jgi:three-Cys-motif partner protein